MPTTSRPRPRSPIKSVKLKVTLPATADLERAAAESGLTVEKRRGGLSLAFSVSTPEEALERLKLLAGLLAPRT